MENNTKNYLLFVLLLSCVNVFSQDNTLLKGQFTGKNLDKSFINVININQYNATISQLDGKFEIEAKAGDSILISSIQYSDMKFVVKPEFFEENIEVPLELKINKLLDVNVYSLGFTGDLAKDAANIKTNDFSQTQLGFAPYVEYFTREERRLHQASSSQGGLPLDYVINLINGNIKKYKKLVENERIVKNKNRLFNLFPDKFYIENLSVPEILVEDFTYYCIENHPEVISLSQQQNKLMLAELLPKLATEYMALKNAEKDKTQPIHD